MKQILIELDERCARDLARVAPAGRGVRADFIRLAIRRAIDLALDRVTMEAYRQEPLSEPLSRADLAGWDEANAFAQHAPRSRSLIKAPARRSSKKKSA